MSGNQPSRGTLERRDSIRLNTNEVENLRQIFDESLKDLVEDESEMTDLLNFTVVMIQNGKTVSEMEQELDDIYGEEYAQRIALSLTDYFQRHNMAKVAEQDQDQQVLPIQEPHEQEPDKSTRVVAIKVRMFTTQSNLMILCFIFILMQTNAFCRSKSSGTGNALTMSGALGSSRKGEGAGTRSDSGNNPSQAKQVSTKGHNKNDKGGDYSDGGNDRAKQAFDRLTKADTRERRNAQNDHGGPRTELKTERGGGNRGHVAGRGSGRGDRGGRRPGLDERPPRGGRVRDNLGGRGRKNEERVDHGGRGRLNDARFARGTGRDDRRLVDRGGRGAGRDHGRGRALTTPSYRAASEPERIVHDDFIPAEREVGKGRGPGRGRMSGHRRARYEDGVVEDDFGNVPGGRGEGYEGGRPGGRGTTRNDHFDGGSGRGRFDRGGGRRNQGGPQGRGPPVKRQRVDEGNDGQGGDGQGEQYHDEAYQGGGYDDYHDDSYYDAGYYYDDGYGGGYGYQSYHGDFYSSGGRFGRGRGRGRVLNSWGRGGRGGRHNGESEAQLNVQEGDGAEAPQPSGVDPTVDAAHVHPSPMVAAVFGGRGAGRVPFRGGRGGRGRSRGGYEHVATILASKQWVRKKDGDGANADRGGDDAGGGDGNGAQG